MTALSDDEVRTAVRDLPGWRFDRGEIFKQYKFPTFLDAIAFIVRLSAKADEENHHPDLENHFNRVRVALHTWTENAVTERDVRLARAIESVAEPPGG